MGTQASVADKLGPVVALDIGEMERIRFADDGIGGCTRMCHPPALKFFKCRGKPRQNTADLRFVAIDHRQDADRRDPACRSV